MIIGIYAHAKSTIDCLLTKPQGIANLMYLTPNIM